MVKSIVIRKKKKTAQAEPSTKETNDGFFQRPVVHILIIVVLGFLIYSNTFHVPFVYDDTSFVVRNPGIKDFRYFKNPWEILTVPTIAPNFRAQFVTRIVTNFTFALNYALHSLNVSGYHIFNLIVHLSNAVLIYYLVLLTFRTPFFSNRSRSQDNSHGTHYQSMIALFSALIFVSHPVQTQAVTYITQRFASLVTTFYLLSVVLYIESRVSESSVSRVVLYAAAVLSVVCAMFTKENAFTLPVSIALYEFMFLDGKIKKRILLLLPIMATMLIIPLIVLKAQGILHYIRAVDKPGIGGIRHGSRWDYLFTEFVVIVTYIRLLFLPVNQNLDYVFPMFHSFWNLSVVLSFLLLLVMFACSIYCFYLSKHSDAADDVRELRLVSYGIIWFFVTLSVESSVIPLDNVIYEHRIYLPSTLLIIAFVTLIFRAKNRIKNRLPFMEKAVIPALVVAVLILSGAAYARNQVWQSGISLWEDVVKKSPYSARAHYNLGVVYNRDNRLDDAIREYQAAIKIYPGYAAAHSDLGVVYGKQGRLKDAEKELQAALKIDPKFTEAHINIAVVCEKLGRLEEAAEEFKTALGLDPYNAYTYANLGVIYAKEGRLKEAEKELQAALKLRPDLTEARRALQLIRTSGK